MCRPSTLMVIGLLLLLLGAWTWRARSAWSLAPGLVALGAPT